ncbi:hypothetical protein PRK78_001013 [Emydomyces testavorans]|uniref:Uncharacterized protein n=1 Tax=Emydomyces testavorans TaxID=2070801 RepID=A0AAF0DDL3_9EURO|nr:hypothetical protein PRK78_001013 [Emydomyces testavorans]
MQDSPKDSASTPPKGDTHAFLVWASVGDRESVREAVRQGNFDELRSAANSKLVFMTERYCRLRDSVEIFEPTLHDLWYGYYQGAKSLSYASAGLDRLAFDILRTRGLGPLTRPVHGSHGVEIARTPAGVLWEDLPFFVTDMTDFWINDCATMEASQRLNFAYFLARLASTGLDNDRLCQIALLVFRDTFETVRPIGSLEKSGDGTMHDLSIAALLPAACAWIREAGRKIIQLSDMSWNDCAGTIGQGGATFTQSELGQRSSAGFSPWRWMYWLKRLDEIMQEATQAGEKNLAEYASEAIEFMLSHVEERKSRVLREFEAAGDFIQDKSRFSIGKFLGWDQNSEGVYEEA